MRRIDGKDMEIAASTAGAEAEVEAVDVGAAGVDSMMFLNVDKCGGRGQER